MNTFPTMTAAVSATAAMPCAMGLTSTWDAAGNYLPSETPRTISAAPADPRDNGVVALASPLSDDDAAEIMGDGENRDDFVEVDFYLRGAWHHSVVFDTTRGDLFAKVRRDIILRWNISSDQLARIGSS